MTMENVLQATILLPFAGAGLVGMVAPFGRSTVRWVALVLTLLVVAGAGVLVSQFQPIGGDQFSTELQVGTPSPVLDVRISLALDGLGIWLFALSAVLLFTSVLVSWEAITDRPALFYGMLLLLTGGCLGIFAARDILLFYVFFEFTLIPLFFLIGIWGSEERRYAALKFFLYTLTGSLLTLLGLLSLVIWDFQQAGGTVLRFSIPELTAALASDAHRMPAAMQLWVFLALFAGFAVKVPLFPLHTWLPLAHVQAPTAGSVFLAGILLKIGTYGFLRFAIPMLPEATAVCMPWILWLAVIGILYGALVALAQQDIKRLIAYSSVSHLGYCMLGIFALNRLGRDGGVLQMVNHGISTGALFALVGMLYERYHTRQIAHLGGLSRRLPWLAFFMLVFTFSSIGLPGLNGFAGEFLVLVGTFQRGFASATLPGARQVQVIAVLAASGVVLGAWYMLWLVQRVFFGPLKEIPGGHAGSAGDHPDVQDLSWREILSLAPLAILAVWIGLYPKFFLDRLDPSVSQLAERAEAALMAPGEPHVYQERPHRPSLAENLTRAD